MLASDPFYSKVITARELLRAEGKSSAADLLIPENVGFALRDHDDWNGGIDSYEVVVDVPIGNYAQLKKNSEIASVTKSISEALSAVFIGEESIDVLGVALRPSASAIELKSDAPIVSNASFWTPGHFRVFISHVTKEKGRASRLKEALAGYGMSCFVSEEDISATSSWHDEISKALKTMDCLIAIISEGFIVSRWCDQEVGFGLGRDVLCIPIKSNVPPYGLFGKYQALPAMERKMREVAEDIFKIVSTNEKTKSIYQKNLADLFLTSKTQKIALDRLTLLEKIPNLEKDVVSGVRLHFAECALSRNKDAVARVNTLLRNNGLEELPPAEKPIATYSEDLPF